MPAASIKTPEMINEKSTKGLRSMSHPSWCAFGFSSLMQKKSSGFERRADIVRIHLSDDALDYMSDLSRLGKNIGDDLAEGKPTLPLLYAMWNGNEHEAKLIENAICNGGLGNLDEIIKTIENTGGLSYTFSLAEKEAEKAQDALDHLPSSVYKDDLERLVSFTVTRSW